MFAVRFLLDRIHLSLAPLYMAWHTHLLRMSLRELFFFFSSSHATHSGGGVTGAGHRHGISTAHNIHIKTGRGEDTGLLWVSGDQMGHVFSSLSQTETDLVIGYTCKQF